MLTCFIGWLAIPAAFAQETLRIHGTITDNKGGVLPGTVVFETNSKQGTTVPAGGEYAFEVPKASDTLNVKVQLAGYTDFEKTLPMPTGNDYKLDVQLANLRVEDVVVTGRVKQKKDEFIQSITTIDQATVSRVAPADLEDVLKNISGYSNNGQISLRGSSGYSYGAGSRVVTLLNSMPVMTPNLGSTESELLPTDNIQQVEVIKGASSVLYGSGAMGGVINVITKDPTEDPYTSFRIRAGVFDEPANDTADWDGRSKAVSGSAHFFHARKLDDFYITMQTDLSTNTGFMENGYKKFNRNLFMFRYDTPVDGLTLRANVQTYTENYNGSPIWSGYPDGALQPRDGFSNDVWQQKIIFDPSIEYEFANGKDKLEYRGRVYDSHEVFSGSNTTGYYDNYRNEIQHTHMFGRRFSLVSGISHNRTSISASSSYGTATSDQVAAFAQFEAEVTDRLHLSAGGRFQYEYISGDTARDDELRKDPAYRYGFTSMAEPIFRGGFNYRFGDNTYLRASAGQAVRSASVAERFTNVRVAGLLNIVPNPRVELEEGFSTELGLRQNFESKNGRWSGTVDLAGFLMKFNNMIEMYIDSEVTVETGDPALQAQNVPDARIAGVELETNVRYQADDFGFALNGGVTLIDPRDPNGNPEWNGDDSTDVIFDEIAPIITGGDVPDDYTFPEDRPSILKYRSRWMVRYTGEISYKNWAMTGICRYDSRVVNIDKLFLIDLLFPGTREFRARNTGGQLVADFIVSYNIPGEDSFSTISFLVNNAFNEEYQGRAATLGPQRNFGLQYRVTL